MGHPFGSLNMTIDFSSVLLNLLGLFKFNFVLMALSRLGLIKPPQQDENPDDQDYTSPSDYVLVEWPTSSSLVPVPAHVLTASIKKRVPVVEYGDVLNRSIGMVNEEKEAVCAVCLCCIEKSHFIRELNNCSHLFHRDCLDNWVDRGHVTCPLCRSMLFPPQGDNASCGGQFPWIMESH